MRNLAAVPATDGWLERVASIRQWTRNGERAPHKPSLLLYALGVSSGTVDNALCLCSMHHKLLDRGVIGIDPGNTVAVSARFVGRGRAAEVLVLDILGRPLHEPQRGHDPPAPAHVEWHHNQVFSGPARIPA